MMPGPDVILACPRCEAPVRLPTMATIHLGLGRHWTDGKGRDSLAPETPRVARCPRCDRCHWLRDAVVVDEIAPWDDTGWRHVRREVRWAGTPRLREPTDEEYYVALDAGELAADPATERGVRLLAWWKRNEPFRYGSDAHGDGTAASAGCRRNLEALVALLDEANDEERLLIAEVHRELGEFADAKRLTGSLVAGPAAAVARRLEAWCDAGNRRVQELAERDPQNPWW
jgi:hypothetical protein